MANYDPVHISINDKPRAILGVMDSLLNRRKEYEAFHARRRRIPRALLLAGALFFLVDVLLGFSSRLFIVVAAALWIAALVMFFILRRARPGSDFAPHYQTARDIVYTLRDDLHPERNFFGHLDLTGAQQPGKLSREAPDALGLAVQHYRDEWLNLKAKLYDGNMLRLSATERVKVRKGYYKRGSISGKQKWKPPKIKGDRAELDVRISVNPHVYQIDAQASERVPARVAPYIIDRLDTSGGIISLSASAPAHTIIASDVLGVLQVAYGLLQRRE